MDHKSRIGLEPAPRRTKIQKVHRRARIRQKKTSDPKLAEAGEDHEESAESLDDTIHGQIEEESDPGEEPESDDELRGQLEERSRSQDHTGGGRQSEELRGEQGRGHRDKHAQVCVLELGVVG